MVSGGCTATHQCVRSPGYPSVYPSYEPCQIRVNVAGSLEVNAFNTDAVHGSLTVGSTMYSGTTGPEGVAVDPMTAVLWSATTGGMLLASLTATLQHTQCMVVCLQHRRKHRLRRHPRAQLQPQL